MFRTVLEMMYDRGYQMTLSQDGESTILLLQDGTDNRISHVKKKDLHWFETTYNLDRTRMSLALMHTDTHQMCIVVFEASDVGTKQLQSLIFQMGDSLKHCIYVFANQPTSPARKILDEMEVEWFLEEELTTNRSLPCKIVTKHPHATKDLPLIDARDWNARYYGAKAGNLIKYQRRSEAAGGYVGWRVVRVLPKIKKKKLL